jgi:glycosyltransferase involved in cell wall biosynthesis
MLVSAIADADLREGVSAGGWPTPEYLRLESHHDVELLDWHQLGLGVGRRSVRRSVRHVTAALGRVRDFEAVLSDGEHIGIPLALAMRRRRTHPCHVMIGHNLLTPTKTRVLRYSDAGQRLDCVVVHSANQLPQIAAQTGLPPDKLAVIPYGVDTAYWSSRVDIEEDQLVASAGREHRDYRTLVASIPTGANLVIADHSPFTPGATRRDPDAWPTTARRVALDPPGLRTLYSRAAVVVVPVVDSPMPAGITTLLEAMAMGKAIVVTETPALRGVVQDGETGITVRPGDVNGMRDAIGDLLASPCARQLLGARAREIAVERYDVEVYASALAGLLAQTAGRKAKRLGLNPPRIPPFWGYQT